MTTTTTSPAISLPSAERKRDRGAAPTLEGGNRVLQTILFVVGAVLLPVGIVIIMLGAYGAARTAFLYDQMTYVVSGGLLGLGLTFAGGFLYFGAWLARIAQDNRESSRQIAEDQRASDRRLSDALLLLADTVSRSSGAPGDSTQGSVLVTAGEGRTAHRRDCSLIADRTDLRPAGADAEHLNRCRICGGD
ncbi:MAG: hypothetical protein ACRDOM_01640 [Nocardioides sp.]